MTRIKLFNRADGFVGHYAIGRELPITGMFEFYTGMSGMEWAGFSCAKVFTTKAAAEFMMTELYPKGFWVKQSCADHTGTFQLECPACNMNDAEFQINEE